MAVKRRTVPTDYADFATALGAANNGDEIIALESGSPYTGANNRGLDPGGLDPLLIKSQRGEHRTIIDPETNDRAFLFNNGESRNVILDGFTIQNGDAGAGDGGGIAITTTSHPTIKNCIIHDCDADYGGGILVDTSSEPLIENVLIYDCSVDERGGGLYVNSSSQPIINNCTIVANHADDDGGGITIITNSTATMTNCIIWGNTATTGGNQIYISGAGDTLNLNYTCYSNGAGDVVNNGALNTTSTITTDPVFVAGDNGAYYLSEIDAGEGADSPCLNTGTGTVGTPGDYVIDYWRRTTRTDNFADTNTLNMGYHYRGVYISGIPAGAPAELRWKPMHKILELAELGVEEQSWLSNRLDLRKKVGLAITARGTFHADGTGDLIIHIVSSADDDDHAGDYDTEDFATLTLTVDPGEIVQRTIEVESAPRFVRVYAENEDDAETITDIEVFAAPLGTEELHDEEMVNYDWS